MTAMYPKPKRMVDPVFMDRVRRIRCAIVGCGSVYTDPHHLTSRGAGGSDYTAIPLCREHHAELHTIGRNRFESRHSVDLWAISARVLAEYIADLVSEKEERCHPLSE
jgi:hypothetical protein